MQRQAPPETEVDSLLAEDEPSAVQIVNADGAGKAILVCDHASADVPRRLGGLGLAPAAFDLHIAWDIGAAEVAGRLSRRLDAPLILSNYSRLVIDLNRRLGDPTSIPETSDGVAVPGNAGLSAADRLRRADALFLPYHIAIANAAEMLRRRDIAPAILSIHSCTPVFQGFARPWHIGVLWNRDPRLPVPLIERLRMAGGRKTSIVVGDNQPYSARDGHGYTLAHHAEAHGLPHALFEIRHDLIATPEGAERWADTIDWALAPILDDPALFAERRF